MVRSRLHISTQELSPGKVLFAYLLGLTVGAFVILNLAGVTAIVLRLFL
jgi:hypothetical protein